MPLLGEIASNSSSERSVSGGLLYLSKGYIWSGSQVGGAKVKSIWSFSANNFEGWISRCSVEELFLESNRPSLDSSFPPIQPSSRISSSLNGLSYSLSIFNQFFLGEEYDWIDLIWTSFRAKSGNCFALSSKGYPGVGCWAGTAFSWSLFFCWSSIAIWVTIVEKSLNISI